MIRLIGRVLRRVCSAAGFVLLGASAVTCALWMVGTLQLLAPGSLASGASYLPLSWLAPAVVLGALLLLFGGRRRAALAATVVYLALLAGWGDWQLPTAGSQRPMDPKDMKSVSVLTLNVQYYRHGRSRVLQEIVGLGPDVALLSEHVLPPAELALAEREVAPYRLISGRPEETAILSRYPVLSFQEVDLPSRQASLQGPNRVAEQVDHPHRSFVHAVIDVDGTPLHAISLRLIAGRSPDRFDEQLEWGGYLLRTQAAEVQFFKEYLARLDGPVVFGGDLNAPPSAAVVRDLGEVARDVYLATHGIGWPTFRTQLPILRLDYLYCSPDVLPLRAQRLDLVISDHFPLLAQLAFAASRGPAVTSREEPARRP